MAREKKSGGRGKSRKETGGEEVKRDEVAIVKLQFPKRDWIFFNFACESHGYNAQEVLRDLFIRWAEDLMKTELPPPG